MILYIASFVLFCLVSVNLFWRVQIPLWAKIAGCMLVLLASLKYEIYQWVGGAFFAPQLPRSLLIVLEAAYGAFFILAFLLILEDIYLLGNFFLCKIGFPAPTRLPRGLINAALSLLAVVCGLYGTWNATRVPPLREMTVKIANLPDDLHGFRIAQLADLHVGPILKQDWTTEVVEKTNAARPDLIVMTGDYIDGTVEEILDQLKPLAGLYAPCGVLAVTGNHEYYWNAKGWSEQIRKLGIDLLENEHRVLNVGKSQLVIGGVPDNHADRFGFDAPNAAKAFAGAPKAVRLLLAHQPKNAPDWLQEADIMLSGHTHGGIIFFLEPLIARFNGGFARGMYDIDGKKLYVSPGTGIWNGFSARVGVAPEITLIILEKE